MRAGDIHGYFYTEYLLRDGICHNPHLGGPAFDEKMNFKVRQSEAFQRPPNPDYPRHVDRV